MLDFGANVACDGLMLVQFAVMGAVMAEHIVGANNPLVALLNIGEEETKSLDPIQHAAALLRDIPSINYIGYLKANELLTEKTDVLVCNGFVGNVTLKSMAWVIRVFLSLLKSSGESGRQGWLMQWVKRWMKRRLIRQFRQLNPDQYNGACLISLRVTVIKSHGAANQRAFTAAIEQALQAVERQIQERIAARLDAMLPKSD